MEAIKERETLSEFPPLPPPVLLQPVLRLGADGGLQGLHVPLCRKSEGIRPIIPFLERPGRSIVPGKCFLLLISVFHESALFVIVFHAQ